MLNFISILFISILLSSCGKTPQEELFDTIEQANNYLTASDCNDAIVLLEDFGIKKSSADFMKVYSSAYACRAGFSMLDIFELDINTIDADNLITSLASLSSSKETVADSDSFIDLQKAINIITESKLEGTNASALRRVDSYGKSKAADLNFQLVFMSIVQMGRFFKLYGDADSTGVKGANGNSDCIYSYTHPDAVSSIGATTPGSCTSATGTEGSSFLELPVTPLKQKQRLCNGVVLFNNFLDTLKNLSLTSDQYGELKDIKDLIDANYSSLIAVEAGSYGTTIVYDVKDIRTQSLCEALDLDEVERYYAFFLENIYQ